MAMQINLFSFLLRSVSWGLDGGPSICHWILGFVCPSFQLNYSCARATAYICGSSSFPALWVYCNVTLWGPKLPLPSLSQVLYSLPQSPWHPFIFFISLYTNSPSVSPVFLQPGSFHTAFTPSFILNTTHSCSHPPTMSLFFIFSHQLLSTLEKPDLPSEYKCASNAHPALESKGFFHHCRWTRQVSAMPCKICRWSLIPV